MTEIYAPKSRVAVASSFEGVFNDGAPECALTSINAYNQQNPDMAFYEAALSAQEFTDSHIDDLTVRGFLALRPLVAVAEDYHTVLEIVRRYPTRIQAFLDHPEDEHLARYFQEKFELLKGETSEERKAFGGDKKESFFYKERKRLKGEDVFSWMNAQRPYEMTLQELRKLAETQGLDENGKIVSGFIPYFATSKDEGSTYDLCVAYTKAEKLIPSDTEGGKCIIPRGRIIGMETVPSRNKVEQLKAIAEHADADHAHVWRVNDMVFDEEIEELFDHGFKNIFVVTGGYVFPHEIEKIRKDSRVKVVERDSMAKELGECAQAWEF